jgi:hypothetical protein
MLEDIEFILDWFAEIETIPGRMRQVALRKGSRLRAEVCPIACRTGANLADLFFADGTVARNVPLARFVIAKRLARPA